MNKVKSIIIKGLQEYFKKNIPTTHLNWYFSRYFNFVTDNKIRSGRIELIQDILTKNNIKFKINTIFEGCSVIKEIELI